MIKPNIRPIKKYYNIVMNHLYSCLINNNTKSDQLKYKEKASNNTESHTVRNRLLSRHRVMHAASSSPASHGAMDHPDS